MFLVEFSYLIFYDFLFIISHIVENYNIIKLFKFLYLYLIKIYHNYIYLVFIIFIIKI